MSLIQLYQIPVIFLISYRGTPGEPVGAQGAMTKVTEEILQTLRIPILNCTSEKDLEKISTFTKHSRIIEGPVAILCDFNLMKADQ